MGWQCKPLENVADKVVVGYVGPSSDYFTEDGVPFLRTGNVGVGQVILSNMKHVVPEFHLKQKKSMLKQGDVLVSRVVSDEVTAAVVPAELEGANCGNIIVIRPGKLLDSRFVMHLIATPASQRQLLGRQVGSAQGVVNTAVLKKWEVPVPPLAEQRRIAAILDKAEALRAQRATATEKLEMLSEATFVDMFGNPATNSKCLPLVSLGELGDWRSGGTPPRTEERYFTGDIPWFSSGELEPMYLDRSTEYITPSAIEETSAKSVPRGSLLLGMYDTAALKASIAGGDCSCNQAVAFAQIRDDVADVVYVYFAIRIGREHFRRLQRGVRQKNLNLEMIRQIRIPLPPRCHQKYFSSIVARFGALKSNQKASTDRVDDLFASLQYRAFRGEL